MANKNINKRGLALTLMLISMCQLGSLAISSVISDITKAFPGTSDQTAQFLMTFPGLFILITSLLSASLTRVISQKKLAITGLILNVVTAFGGLLIHSSIVPVFCWAATLGLGLGLWMPIVNAIASQHFEGDARAALLGRMSSAINIGAILMTVIGGALAVLAWHYVYFVYFIAVPGLVCAVIFLPDEKVQTAKGEKKKLSLSEMGIDKAVILFSLIQFYFSLPYNAGPSNFSLLLSESGIGNASTAGLLSGLFLFGGIISGWFFGALNRKIGRHTTPVGYLLLGLGLAGLGISHSLPLYMLFTVIGGMSLPLTLPQASLGVVEGKRPEQFAMASAVLMAFGNLGAFCSPFTTSMAAAITGSAAISTRLIFCAGLSALGALVTFIIFKMRKER